MRLPVTITKYKNWWGESLREEYERRINALEAHIQELSITVSQLYAAVNRSEYERLATSGEMREANDDKSMEQG